jgi:ankyrin repeat protein
LRPDDASVECLQTLCSLAAPVYPLESLHGPKHRFNWISLHETYTKWLDSYGPNILHVHGTTGASDASEYIFQCLDAYRAVKQKNEILVYFTFQGHDDRCNSVMAMLNTLLAQILNHRQDLYDAVGLQYERMSFDGSWTQADLMRLFKNALLACEHGGALCVINGLDECDDSRMVFLKDLSRFASLTERRCKIAITSTADSDLQAALADWPTINLDDHREDPDTTNTNPASDIELEVQELMLQHPAFCDFEKTITEKLFECRQDRHWRHLVLNQLRLCRCPSTKAAIQRELDLLPPTPSKDIFARILAKVPSDRRVWARKALTWILYAFHPLKIWELGVALALEVDSLSDETIDLDELLYRHVVADLDEVFGGMFVVKHNEVHFGHPDVREFLLVADGKQEHVWYDVKETAHKEITDACYLYLSLEHVQDSIAMSYCNPPTDPLGPPAFIPRYSLHVYATKYWPKHYRLIPETFCPTARALEFVQNTKAMCCWAETYWRLSNPISRTDRAFLSLLPIFAGLGLQGLVTEWIERDAETPEASQDRALALIEAARNAHLEVVRRLLRCGGYTEARLQDALIAGASCCGEAVLDELVTYAAESIENFEWPPAILCLAAQFGLEHGVRKLLGSGASLDTAITVHDMTPLHLAARQGHMGVVKVLLEHKASLTALCVDDSFPLHLASAHGDPAIVKALLDAGAEVNAVDALKCNAIGDACAKGNYKAVEILVEAGCDMDEQGEYPALTIAAAEGFLKSARVLVEKKANTEVGRPGSVTPLSCAAYGGHVEICQLLLENGANVNTTGRGPPILVESAIQGNLEVVKMLVENGAAVNAVDTDGMAALHHASLLGHMSVVTCLLDHGADINYANQTGHTPILLAAQSGFAELVQLLIGRGADVHSTTTAGWTPVHLSDCHAETTRVLMENGADANRVAAGCTPLYLSASDNQIEVVKVLLSFNLDLEIPYAGDGYERGFTALTIATVEGYTDVVRLLLEAGANVNHKSDHNTFPLQYAVIFNREDVLRVLMEYHPDLDLVDDDGDTALHCIRRSTSPTIAKLLINGGSDPESRNNHGNTPICMAVMSENLDIVKYLIAKKTELNIIGGKYGGPLHLACYWSNLELVQILVAARANVNLVDPCAGTPLQSACHRPESGDEKGMQESIIRYLINEAMADVKTVGGPHGCALNAACGWSTPEMVKLILEKDANIEVKDEMGRAAIHFAAAQIPELFQKILDAGADVDVRDKMHRTAIHWATIGGVIDTIERVLSLSRGIVDQADIDGWTPLLWAARGCGRYNKPTTSNAQKKIIKLLLDRGADPCVRWKGLDREWSPVKVARYHGVDDAVVQLLMAKAKEKLAAEGAAGTWDEAFHASRKALKQNGYCDSCLFVSVLMLSSLILLVPNHPQIPRPSPSRSVKKHPPVLRSAFLMTSKRKSIDGIRYKCETCLDFDFCYKCYLSRHLMHPDHSFKTIGPEYEPVVEEAPAEEECDKQEDDDTDDE